MPKYVYEAISETGEILRTFEVWQSIKDAPLEIDSETGAKCRKIIAPTMIGKSSSSAVPWASHGSVSHSCGSGCRCGH